MTTEPIQISLEQARRFLLRRQGLLGKHIFVGKPGALAYVRQAGCIQYDPVDVCGKNAELTLQSRVKGFRKSMLHDLLYKDRQLVDYSDKELAIFPVENWPYFKGYRDRSLAHGRQFPGLAELENQAVAYIQEHGPVSSDILPIDGSIFWHSSIHWSGNWEKDSKASRSVLEQMYTDGRLVIHHKAGSRKFYDLSSRYIPQELLEAEDPCPTEMDHIQWRVLHRIGAVGLLWNRRSDAFLGIAMTTEQRNRAFEALEEEGAILPVSVEGIKPLLYMRREDLPLMQEVLDPETKYPARCEFLAPLDPFLWDRKLILNLFGFRYSWEIYTPAEKRKYGYYVLPILYGERFVGRIEAAADHKQGLLFIKNVWLEDGVRRTKRLDEAIKKASARLAAFNGCDLAKE